LLSQAAAFAVSIGWRPLAVGLTAFAILELAERLIGRTRIFSNLEVSPRWFRWSVHGVAYLLLLVGFLLLFLRGSVREPFLYEVF